MNPFPLVALVLALATLASGASAQGAEPAAGERICPQAGAATAAASLIEGAAPPAAEGRGGPSPSGPETAGPSTGIAHATFGMGCFWRAEAAFCGLPGVVGTQVGYAGGWAPAPSYEQVSSGRTGHAEVVQVAYDPAQIAYEDLLAVFWQGHDPTTPDRQGPDMGSQYRSLIFFYSPEQEAAARASLAQLARTLPRPIVTELVPAAAFYPAEDYHQRYLERHGRGRCNP
jgi:peptide-methionine (S)-S-oxide reductase